MVAVWLGGGVILISILSMCCTIIKEGVGVGGFLVMSEIMQRIYSSLCLVAHFEGLFGNQKCVIFIYAASNKERQTTC